MRSIFSSHGFDLSEGELVQFEQFLALFIEYNSHTNLSAIRDAEGIILKHFVDSLYGASIIGELLGEHKKLLDIGSGGGFPGIPLKLVMPDLHITLLDSVGKKVKAMNHFVMNLDLENISAIHARAEDLAKDPDHAGKYDIVVSRATAYIDDILRWSLPFLAPGGSIILYKMPSTDEYRDMKQLLKKYHLTLIGQSQYSLADRARVLYVITRR